MPDFPELGEWLSAEMDRRALSARELSKRTKIGHSRIGEWRIGKGRPSYANCAKLAEALHVDVDMVRRLAKYSEEPAEAHITEASLSGDEWELVRAYRGGDAQVQAHLLSVVEVVRRIQNVTEDVASDAAT